MDLVAAWLRQLLRAGTAAALVPAAIVAALVVVIVGAGGLGGLGSLGQLVSGPQVSPAEREAARASRSGRDVAPVSPAVARESRRRREGAGRRAQPGPTAPPGPVAPRPAQPGGAASGIDPGRRPTARPAIKTLADPPVEPRPAGRSRPPTLKERSQVLGQKLHETVGEVGTVVKEIVDGLAQTLGRITKPPPQGGR